MKTILLVDDAQLMLEIEKALFRRTGARILTASTGTQALKLLMSEKPDIVLLDLMLPDITGDKICEQVKANPATQSIPVIMVTTRGKPEDVDRCRRAGCDDFATKPLNHYELLGKVASFLNLPTRRNRRMLVQLRVSLGHEDENFFGSSLDLSSTGMRIETSKKLNENDEVQMDFLLPGKRAVQVQGCVVRIERAPFGKFRYGVQFMNLAEPYREMIQELVGSSSDFRHQDSRQSD